MEAWTHGTVMWLLEMWALPEIGLSAIFIISLVSATLLPMGSEPAVLAYAALEPSQFWFAILVATLGNTIGGTISYWMGLGAAKSYAKWKAKNPQDTGETEQNYSKKAAGRWHQLITHWLQRLGPKAMLFTWLPLVGDPLCAVAGWMRMSFWPSVFYMAIGKFLRYVIMTSAILWLLPHLGW